MSNQQQETITCECCGKIVDSYKSESVSTKQGDKRICDDCYKHLYCRICGKLDINHSETFSKFGEYNVCSNCVQEKIDLCKKYLVGFMEYTKKFYSRDKWAPYYCMADSSNVESYIRNNNNFKDIVTIAAQGWGRAQADDNRSMYFKLFTDLVGENFDDINVLSAHWNDFLVKNPDLPFIIEDVIVNGGCKRCGKDIEINCDNSKHFYAEVTYVDFTGTAFELYTRIKNDSDYKCRYCSAWVDIIGELRKKFGWNPKWRIALDEFEEFGKGKDIQAGPMDFYRILTKNEIVMSQQVVDVWNAIYERRDGNLIIKCYAVPDSPRAQIEQNVSRAADGLLKGIRKLFG